MTLWAQTYGRELDRILEIRDIAEELQPHAQLVLLKIAQRLKVGQAEYGTLNLLLDKRNWREEKRQEIYDYVVYDAMEECQRELREVERRERDVAILKSMQDRGSFGDGPPDTHE